MRGNKMRAALLLLALCFPVYGDIFSVAIDATAFPIPGSFSASSSSKVLQNIRNVRAVAINNDTPAKLVVNCSYAGTFVPADNDQHNMYVPAYGSIGLDQAYLAGTCYIRTKSGTPQSSGEAEIMLIGG